MPPRPGKPEFFCAGISVGGGPLDADFWMLEYPVESRYSGLFQLSFVNLLRFKGVAVFISFIFLLCVGVPICPQQSNAQTPGQLSTSRPSSLTGVYRIDIPASDKLYSVVAGASSDVPFAEQQRFFIDLAVRLTPPDLLAIEQIGKSVSLGSSRAQRMTFVADGVTRTTRTHDGHEVRVRFAVEDSLGNPRLVFTSSGRTEDNFSVVFESLDNGKRLRVVRRIAAEKLDKPLVIRTIYNKVSDVAQWELYGETQVAAADSAANPVSKSKTVAAPPKVATPASQPAERVSSVAMPAAAEVLRAALKDWIAATNNREIDKQMSFYVSRLKAYYLTRNTSRAFVRDEKARVFATARVIDIQAEEPEIVFQDGGNTGVMRYRKKYRIENGRQSRRGQVIQELRWQRVGQEWRIFSERDIRVL